MEFWGFRAVLFLVHLLFLFLLLLVEGLDDHNLGRFLLFSTVVVKEKAVHAVGPAGTSSAVVLGQQATGDEAATFLLATLAPSSSPLAALFHSISIGAGVAA